MHQIMTIGRMQRQYGFVPWRRPKPLTVWKIENQEKLLLWFRCSPEKFEMYERLLYAARQVQRVDLSKRSLEEGEIPFTVCHHVEGKKIKYTPLHESLAPACEDDNFLHLGPSALLSGVACVPQTNIDDNM